MNMRSKVWDAKREKEAERTRSHGEGRIWNRNERLERDFADWAQCVQQWGLSWEQPETRLGQRDLMALWRSLDLAQWKWQSLEVFEQKSELSEKHNLAVEEPGFEQSIDTSVETMASCTSGHSRWNQAKKLNARPRTTSFSAYTKPHP